jgi:hypothetical protein
VALDGSWELADCLVCIHKEEAGSWARSFVSLAVEGLEGNVVVDMSAGKVVGRAADRVANALADSDIDSLTWRSLYLEL